MNIILPTASCYLPAMCCLYVLILSITTFRIIKFFYVCVLCIGYIVYKVVVDVMCVWGGLEGERKR